MTKRIVVILTETERNAVTTAINNWDPEQRGSPGERALQAALDRVSDKMRDAPSFARIANAVGALCGMVEAGEDMGPALVRGARTLRAWLR